MQPSPLIRSPLWPSRPRFAGQAPDPALVAEAIRRLGPKEVCHLGDVARCPPYDTNFALPGEKAMLFVQRTENGELCLAPYYQGPEDPTIRMIGPQGETALSGYREYLLEPGSTLVFPSGYRLTLERTE